MADFTQNNEFFDVKPEHIHVKEGFNPRKDFGNIKELAANIRANGLFEPLIVRKNDEGFQLIDGERRFRAISLLMEKDEGPDVVPCRIMEMTDIEALVATVATGTGLSLNALEQAEVCERLAEDGHKQKDIAKMFGMSQAWVSQRFKLLKVIKQAVNAFTKGKITQSALLEVANAKGEDKSPEAKQDAEAEHLAKVLGKRPAVRADGDNKPAGAIKKPGKKLIKEFVEEFLSYSEDATWSAGDITTMLLWCAGECTHEQAMKSLSYEDGAERDVAEGYLSPEPPSRPGKPEDSV